MVVAKGADQFLSVKNTSWKYRTDWKSCAPAPEGCAPTEPWKDQFLAEFDLARKTLLSRKERDASGNNATAGSGSKAGSDRTKPGPLNQRLPDLQDEDAWLLLMYGSQVQSPKDKITLGKSKSESLSTPLKEQLSPRPRFLVRLDQGCVMRLLKYHLRWLSAHDISEQEVRNAPCSLA